MKCSKCGYLGFETGDRCRNCGYDFSLTDLLARDGADTADDLPIRTELDTAGPLADFRLDPAFDRARDEPPRLGHAEAGLDLDRLIGAPEPSPPRGPDPESNPAPGGGEGLFPAAGSDPGEPVPRPRAAPRPPLSVRRATPEVPRLRPRHTPSGRTTPRQTPRPSRAGAFDADTPPLGGLGLGPDLISDAGGAGAPLVRRLAAALLDLTVVGAIDGAVLYFTLRLLGLTFAEATVLPWVPLASFFLLVDGGYFVTFAAVGGQTIGQMACGLKVVGRDGLPLAFGTATFRTLTWIASTLPFGLGLWFALGPDHLALHDRVTSTRVVLL